MTIAGMFKEAMRVARKARVPWWRRLPFAIHVTLRWTRNGHSVEEAVNHVLSSHFWNRIGW